MVYVEEKHQGKLDKESAKRIYKYNFERLPFSTCESREQLVLNGRFITYEQYYWGYFEFLKPQSESTINERILREKKSLNLPSFVDDVLVSWLHDVPRNLSKNIRKSKNSHFLPCVDDSDLIIQHYINFYTEAINSNDRQINFFLTDLSLNKRLSDIMAAAVVKILKKVLELRQSNGILTDAELSLNPNPEGSYKLIWNGKQKELIELIVELQNRGWIEPIREGHLRKAAKGISNFFDITSTKRSSDSDEVTSLLQLLKGSFDSDHNERIYDFGKRYEKKFDQIKSNL